MAPFIPAGPVDSTSEPTAVARHPERRTDRRAANQSTGKGRTWALCTILIRRQGQDSPFLPNLEAGCHTSAAGSACLRVGSSKGGRGG